ncbi:MAG: hypothetical protein ACJA0U_002572 [Salibacteraceae bacterium]|jgi:hypothetical protein
MKKILIISLTVIGLGFVSCQKENITPGSAESPELPTWENARGIDEDDSEGGDDDFTIGAITDPNDDDGPPSDEPPITDPNDDSGKTKGNKVISATVGNGK